MSSSKLLYQDLLLSFYGDDFTGSTDVMESLALNGVRTALFLQAPTPEEVRQFQLKKTWPPSERRDLQAFGVAGISRSLPVEQMRNELAPIFEKLSRIKTDFFQYKICSTFDSSPEIGSIGFATDLAHRYFPSKYIPLVVGAPFLNRFCIFGNLFARIDGVTYRLDRHPTMSRHPVTPMGESDLRLHLKKQTRRKVALMDLFTVEQGQIARQRTFEKMDLQNGEMLLFDTYSMEHLLHTGETICSNVEPGGCQLIVGSSGVEYAVCYHLHKTGRLVKPDRPQSPGHAEQIIAVSGSCAPTTAQQIEWAVEKGFADIRIDSRAIIDPGRSEQEEQRVIREALQQLDRGRSAVLYTAKGPDDPAIEQTKKAMDQSGHTSESAGRRLAAVQGKILKKILEQKGQIRTIVCGGDTSGHVARTLGIYALETLMPIAPGAPLCLAHSANPHFDGLEISLKGGQNGQYDYFEMVLRGG